MSLFGSAESGAGKLRRRLAGPEILVTPGCFDALSARIIEGAGFEAAFLGGFAVSATRLAVPDAGLLSYREMTDQGRDVCAAVSIPVLGDADTGYGNPINAQRTIRGYAQAGFAGLMIEDQVWPKRCGHTRGKLTVDRETAIQRVRAALDESAEAEIDIFVIARTDAAGTEGFDEALRRAEAFVEVGADMTFVEAPESVEEMRRYCEEIPGLKMANMVEEGKTPWQSPQELQDIGYDLVAFPLTLLMANVAAMQRAAESLRSGEAGASGVSFEELQELVGFPDYWRRANLYSTGESETEDKESTPED